MARAPVLAAGGIVVREGPTPLIALVQRRKDNGWVLPKGKLKRKESAVAAARREAIEETGHTVFVHEFLGAIPYKAGRRPKLARFWRMQAVALSGRKPTREIKAVQWLPLELAIDKLSLPLEQVFLRNVGPRALKRVTLSDQAAGTVRESVRPLPTMRDEPIVASTPAAVTAPKPRKSFLQRFFGVFGARPPDGGRP